MKENLVIIGGGYSGCCLANMLKDRYDIRIVEKDRLLGGLCKTYYFEGMQYEYGPHIFANHNSTRRAIDFVKKYIALVPTKMATAAYINSTVTPFPPSMASAEALGLSESVRQEVDSLPAIAREDNFEQYLTDRVGPTLYKLYFDSFTKKFWGVNPGKLSAEWAKIRHLGESLNDKEPFFNKRYCAYPKHDWNELFANIVSAETEIETACEVVGIDFDKNEIITGDGQRFSYHLLISTLAIDALFDFSLGRLDFAGYEIRPDVIDREWYLTYTGAPVSMVYYPGRETEYTRVTDYKTFNHKKDRPEYREKTIITREYPSKKNRFYPFYDDRNKRLLEKYLAMAATYSNVVTFGRLGLYKYLTVDTTTEMAFRLSAVLKMWPRLTVQKRYETYMQIRGEWYN